MKHLIARIVLAALCLCLPASAHATKTHLTMGVVLEPPYLDPTAGAAAAIDEIGYANIFEGLTRIDRAGKVKPALAASWTISEDGLTYTFALQDGVTFHDGSTFDSSDVAFSLNRAMADTSTNTQKVLFSAIAAVETPDARTVVLRLSRPAGELLFNLGWGDAVIVAPESAANNKTHPIGTGPFRFKRWVKGDRVEIEQYGAYWGKRPALKTATFKFIPDAAAAFAALMSGAVDAFPNFPSPESLLAFQSDSRFMVVVGQTEGETILAMNHASKPLSNLKVRQAISHAIDRQAIIDGAMFGFGTPIGSHFSPHHPAYKDLTGVYPYDLAKAKALMKEAGYGSGFKMRMMLPPPTYARRGGEIIAQQLRKIGIEVAIMPVGWAQWLEQVFRGKDYDLTIVSHTEPVDIGIYARDSYYFNYKSADFKAIMARLAKAQNPANRRSILQEAQTYLANDAVNGFLFQLAKQGVWDANIEGLWHHAPVQGNDLTNVRWKN